MKLHTPLISLLLSLSLLAACATPVKTEHDPEVAFADYQRFAFQAPEREGATDPVWDSPLLDGRVATAVGEVLSQRGYERVDADAADFLVTYRVLDRRQVSGGGSRVSLGMGSGGFGAGVTLGGSRPSIERVLLIDVLDRDTGRLAWRGWKEIGSRQNALEGERLQPLVRTVLDKFPPTAR